ncbi:hypothetical protein AB0M46_00925 [Dactylosporangium sp. NPDC051485]|uniref:hypothetical protein n=1 Tax=Dactylosporangium sp. NPDC051485 TaxID=3154846 RepID=UPI00341F0AF9
MTRRATAALLRFAARRWPERLREELLREWAAEAHVLGEQGRRWAMLRYAGSLAIARPAREPVSALQHVHNGWRAARLVLLGPLLVMLMLTLSLKAGWAAVGALPVGFTAVMRLYIPATTVMCLLAAVLLALVGRSWSLPGRPVLVLAAVTLAPLALLTLLEARLGPPMQLALLGPANAVYFLGLALLLAWTGSRARAGRRRTAWLLAVLGAVVLADVAMMVLILRANPAPTPALFGAPQWWMYSLTGRVLGLSNWDAFGVGSLAEVGTWTRMLFTGFAIGAALGRPAAGASGRTSRGLPDIAPGRP